jgi:arylsulfatase A-like enzyme
MTMVRTQRWKLVHFDGFPPQLFDLENDPLEVRDLGRHAGNESVKRELADRMFEWMRSRRNRVAMSDEAAAARPGPGAAGGVTIGEW